MTAALEVWARVERQFIQDEIKWLKAGGVVTSPSGENITANKVVELAARLEHVNTVLDD